MRARREARALVEQVLLRTAGLDRKDIHIRIYTRAAEIEPQPIRQRSPSRTARQFQEWVTPQLLVGRASAQPIGGPTDPGRPLRPPPQPFFDLPIEGALELHVLH